MVLSLNIRSRKLFNLIAADKYRSRFWSYSELGRNFAPEYSSPPERTQPSHHRRLSLRI